MRFQRYGSSLHLVIEDAADLDSALSLDEALWVATSAPVATLNSDPQLLRILDTDSSGRINCRQVKDAIRWTLELLADHRDLSAGRDVLHLDAIDPDHPDGASIIDSVRKILSRLGTPEESAVSLADVCRIKTQVEAMPVSEAGVVLPAASHDEEVRGFLSDVIAAVGGAPHPSGEQGVGEGQLVQFLSAARDYLHWHDRGTPGPDQQPTDVMPLGDRTPAAYAAYAAIRGKVDQYFAQCEAAALDERFVQRMGWTDRELLELDFDDPAVIENVLKTAPLARARADRVLDLEAPVNPYYREALQRFLDVAAEAVLGEEVRTRLTSSQYQQVRDFYQAHHDWVASRPGGAVDALGVQKLRDYQQGRYAAAVRDLISESSRTAFVLDNIRLTEKILLLQANLVNLANNFVSFPHLYNPKARAMFEMGTLVMDGRRFNVAVRVENRAASVELIRASNMLLLYVEVRPIAGTPYEVAVPVTAGGRGNLGVSKRGVFQDVWGGEHPARVVQMVDNPVSLREAVVAPFKRLGRMITGKIESLSTEAEKKFETTASQRLNEVAPPGGTQAAPAAPAPAVRSAIATGGMLAGAGLAVAALGSSLAYITKTLSQTSWVAILVTVLVAAGAVIVPTTLLALIKLRKRDLRAVLEASDWGINARMRLTRRQRKFFTRRPRYPKGKSKTVIDL
ncbi:MAG: hypothetical protein ACLFV7_06675 [Phycisphaerae bacterium]